MIDKDFMKDEIRSIFNLIDGDKFYMITALPDEYRGYVVSDSSYKGVGIEIDQKYRDFRYSFENIKLFVKEKATNGRQFYMLELVTDQAFDIDKFSNLCLDFLDPGENGERRNQIQENPQTWVDDWKLLIGNRATESKIYDYLGELVILKQLLKDGENAVMTSQGSHDIETPNSNIEVKTTIMRYQSLIEIHSKYQLQRLNNDPLFLYFVRLEESISGISINSMLNDLKELNYDMSNIRKKISELDSNVKEKCYKVNEVRKYFINDNFPKITDDTFVGGKMPENISSLKYTIDLDGLSYESIKIDII